MYFLRLSDVWGCFTFIALTFQNYVIGKVICEFPGNPSDVFCIFVSVCSIVQEMIQKGDKRIHAFRKKFYVSHKVRSRHVCFIEQDTRTLTHTFYVTFSSVCVLQTPTHTRTQPYTHSYICGNFSSTNLSAS